MTPKKEEPLPLQTLLEGEYARVYRFRSGMNALSVLPHRHDHYELMMVTAADGRHLIDFRPYPLVPGRVFFLHPGQAHVIDEFDRDGWLVLFGEELFSRFLFIHQQENGQGILDSFTEAPYVDLDPQTQNRYDFIIGEIRQALSLPKPDVAQLFHYVSLLLLYANRLHAVQHPQPALSPKDKEVISHFKQLLETHFRNHHSIHFYSSQLSLSIRQLNTICKRSMGYTGFELLQSRLLTESKVLLYTSPLSVKEISYQLGFEDPAYFGRFFRKHTGSTPAMFRTARAL